MGPLTNKINDFERYIRAVVVYGNLYRSHFPHKLFSELTDNLGSQTFYFFYFKLNEKTF